MPDIVKEISRTSCDCSVCNVILCIIALSLCSESTAVASAAVRNQYISQQAARSSDQVSFVFHSSSFFITIAQSLQKHINMRKFALNNHFASISWTIPLRLPFSITTHTHIYCIAVQLISLASIIFYSAFP